MSRYKLRKITIKNEIIDFEPKTEDIEIFNTREEIKKYMDDQIYEFEGEMKIETKKLTFITKEETIEFIIEKIEE